MIIFVEAGRRVESPEVRMSIPEDRIMGPGEDAILFGPFRLLPTRRLLLEAGKPVRLGSRALDLLIALVERPGELLSKDELMARVWPDVTVTESKLKVQVAALRDGRDGNRYLLAVFGRGYSFVGSVTLAAGRQRAAPTAAALARLIGRPDDLGFTAKAFRSAEDFLKFNRLQGTSCLIADMRMPGVTGLELHNPLAASGNVIPTIPITAFPDERDRTRALQAGVICYLAEPFAEDDLLTCINSALERREADGRRS